MHRRDPALGSGSLDPSARAQKTSARFQALAAQRCRISNWSILSLPQQSRSKRVGEARRLCPKQEAELSLTRLQHMRVSVSPVHGALGHPDGPLLGGAALSGPPVLLLLLLHADHNVLGVQVRVGGRLAGPGFTVGAASGVGSRGRSTLATGTEGKTEKGNRRGKTE